MKLCWLCHKR